jgi:ABC-type uncharacterized transport system permease subunit
MSERPVTEATMHAEEPPQASVPEPPPPTLAARALRIALLPFIAIALALVVGAVVMILSSPLVRGEVQLDLPLTAYGALAVGAFGSFNGIVSTLVNATPLILAGLAVGIGFKAGLFNIGAQGQFLIGALSSAAAAVSLPPGTPAPLAITLALLAGMAGGFAYGFIPGALKAWTGAHEVVTTIMLNYVAIQTVAYVVSGPLRGEGVDFARTAEVGAAALPVLIGRNGHLGLLFAAAAIPLAWWVLYRSTIGFEIRTVGANPEAARYAGMRPRRVIVLTLAFCGLLAGLAGAAQTLGQTGYMPAALATGVGFDAIAVALLGRAHPFGILFAGLLFGGMRAGSGLMQIQAGIPVQMVAVLQAVILFFLAAELLVRRLLRVRATAEVSELQTVTRSYGEQVAR